MTYTFRSRKPGNKTCKKCGVPFPIRVLVEGQVRHLGSRAYCLECSPFGEHKGSPYVMDPAKADPDRTCPNCGKTYCYTGKTGSKGHRRNLCNTCRTVKGCQQRKAKAIAYKGGKCSRCGYDKSPNALCFHHREPSEKHATISRLVGLSWERLLPELDKCELLCLNCHAEVHQEIQHDRSHPRTRISQSDG